MSNYVKLATDAGDQYLTTLAEAQENFLKTTTALAAKLPPAPADGDARLHSPAFPTAQEVTEASFAFAQKLLKQQKSFAEKLLATGTPATATQVTSHARRGGDPSPPWVAAAPFAAGLEYHTERTDALGLFLPTR